MSLCASRYHNKFKYKQGVFLKSVEIHSHGFCQTEVSRHEFIKTPVLSERVKKTLQMLECEPTEFSSPTLIFMSDHDFVRVDNLFTGLLYTQTKLSILRPEEDILVITPHFHGKLLAEHLVCP